MGNLFSRGMFVHCARIVLEDNSQGPRVLCKASGGSRLLLAIAEEVAKQHCAAMGRSRTDQAHSWRRVLGNLCPQPKASMQLSGHSGVAFLSRHSWLK